MTVQSNLDAALRLGAAGLFVFPVQVSFNSTTGRWDKKPCIAGWQDKARSDESAIRAFWCAYPHALPGLALGRAGLVVLDADRHGGPDGVSAFHALIEQHGLPPGVVKVNTAGSGEHWIFRNLADDPLGNGEGVLPGGINIRGRGGFIVAPGAIRPDGMRWIEPEDNSKLITAAREDTLPEMPSWLVGMIRGHQQEQRTSSGHHSGEREFAYATAALQGECDRVAAALPGSRNNTLFKAAAALGSIAAVGWLDPDVIRSHLFEAALTCGLVRGDGNAAVRATIASGLKAGMANPHIPVSEDERFGRFGNFGTTSDEQVWGEPDPFYLGSGRSKPVHFPSDLLGSFWGDWCEAHAAARHVPVDYVAAGLLASASALVGNARWPCATPEWKEPPVLWAAIVGSPSAGKSPALDPVLGMVRQIEREAIEAGQSARVQYQEDLELAQANAAEWQRQVKEALRRGEPPPPRPSAAVDPDPVPLPRIIVGDTTPERLGVLLRDNPKGLLLNRDEMAGWLGSLEVARFV